MRKLVLRIDRVLNAVNTMVGAMMAFGVALTFMLLASQVMLRHLLSAPFNWLEEGARYLMAMLTLLGASLLLREGLHLQVDLFEDRAPLLLGRMARIAALLATGIFGDGRGIWRWTG